MKGDGVLVCVTGTGFSGSTLLSFLLDSHPEIVSVGEATGPFIHWKDKATYPCTCGSPIGECALWRRVGKEMARRSFRFDPDHWDVRFELGSGRWTRQILSRSLGHPDLDDVRDWFVLHASPWGGRLRQLAARNAAYVASIQAASGKRIMVDASKDPVRARAFERLTQIDPLHIHLVRDSPGYASSHLKNIARSQPEKATIDNAIQTWNRMAGHVERLYAIVPETRRIRVRYEDLCRDPASTLRRITDFLGAEPFEGPVDFRASMHHIIGNDMRMGTSSEIRLDEAWRDRLTPVQVAEIERRTARGRRAFGYAA